jgi:hypothetical protein
VGRACVNLRWPSPRPVSLAPNRTGGRQLVRWEREPARRDTTRRVARGARSSRWRPAPEARRTRPPPRRRTTSIITDMASTRGASTATFESTYGPMRPDRRERRPGARPLVVCGVPAAGKSTLAAALARTTGRRPKHPWPSHSASSWRSFRRSRPQLERKTADDRAHRSEAIRLAWKVGGADVGQVVRRSGDGMNPIQPGAAPPCRF